MERTVEFGGAQLPVTDLGTGGALVMLHAGVADRRSWNGLASALGDRWRTVTFDRRGFGGSSCTPTSHSHTDDLIAVLDACGIERGVLIGNSQGGRVAIEATLAHPTRVSGLILVGTAVSGGPQLEAAEKQVIAELTTAIDAAENAGDLDEVNELEAALWLDGPTSQRGRVSGATRELFLAMNATALRAGDVGDCQWLYDSWSSLDQISVPTLVVVGELDLPHLIRRSELIAQRIPGASLVRLPRRAHLPALEDPVEFAAAIGPFLNGLPQGVVE